MRQFPFGNGAGSFCMSVKPMQRTPPSQLTGSSSGPRSARSARSRVAVSEAFLRMPAAVFLHLHHLLLQHHLLLYLICPCPLPLSVFPQFHHRSHNQKFSRNFNDNKPSSTTMKMTMTTTIPSKTTRTSTTIRLILRRLRCASDIALPLAALAVKSQVAKAASRISRDKRTCDNYATEAAVVVVEVVEGRRR